MNQAIKQTSTPSYTVIVIDALDTFYYADFMGEWSIFDTLTNLEVAKDLADALFVVKNYKWTSLKEMNSYDAGYDVRIYDKNHDCIYKAHTKYQQYWIGENRSKNPKTGHEGQIYTRTKRTLEYLLAKLKSRFLP